jgi:hypothetical protein
MVDVLVTMKKKNLRKKVAALVQEAVNSTTRSLTLRSIPLRKLFGICGNTLAVLTSILGASHLY